jgi:hypothetical protein
MDWKALGEELAKIGLPLLGAALPLPGGMAIGTALASAIGNASAKPEDILATLTANADAVQKAKEFESTHQERLMQMSYDNEVRMAQLATGQVEAVNKTLQTESMGGSYWQRNHHAFESSFVCLMIAGIYIGLPLARIPVPTVDPTVWLMLGGILGVTAWQRGQVNRAVVSG